MISRHNILQKVVAALREVLKKTSLNKDLRGISFEYQLSETAPVRLRCRMQANGTKLKEQVGQSLTKEIWRLGMFEDFMDKFKYFLKILKKVKPMIFEGWTPKQLNILLMEAEEAAQNLALENKIIGAYFLNRQF
ncbi:hypothetical protein TTHERM_00142280 (macronuclear) [Tetrahymena thermophila SB210]|uniref:Uncharacterized protein n=1 Tax=Tetrahymena thermophila (strain SB210) TaxID=312017 RepID=I7MDR7_TETTS|nr:hypothetical protein TTHERM_00142280 [Tetrahymena thermophila SB210]EAR90821.1 hypothetical protein TTHERM_00142280 [Tetrahymena thermophila SB210]|eukprot:XP_001011066.1 hypothetical protein TTHERM_00142280 [Tetrahymena thermophila SB210]